MLRKKDHTIPRLEKWLTVKGEKDERKGTSMKPSCSTDVEGKMKRTSTSM